MNTRFRLNIPILLIFIAAMAIVGVAAAKLQPRARQSHIGRVVVERKGSNSHELLSFTAPKVRYGGKSQTVSKSKRRASSRAASACRKGHSSFFVRTSAFDHLWDVTFAVECKGFGVKLVPLLEGYRSKGKRHMPIVEPIAAKAAKAGGYRTRRVLAQISRSTRKGTRPLFLFYHPGRKDYRAVSVKQSMKDATKDGYQMKALLGYVFKTPADLKAAYPDASPMRLTSVYHPKRKDSLLLVNGKGGASKNPKGYTYINRHYEGWALAYPRMR